MNFGKEKNYSICKMLHCGTEKEILIRNDKKNDLLIFKGREGLRGWRNKFIVLEWKGVFFE
jgi:hypothetical protein